MCRCIYLHVSVHSSGRQDIIIQLIELINSYYSYVLCSWTSTRDRRELTETFFYLNKRIGRHRFERWWRQLLPIYVYIKFCELHHNVVLLLLDMDKKRHDEALENHPKYAKNGREREKKEGKKDIRKAREKRNMYDTLVQFCQAFTCLPILSNTLSSDEVFLAFNHRWSYLQLLYLSLIVVCTSCKQLISLPLCLRSPVYTHTYILRYSMSLKYTIYIWFRSILMKKKQSERKKSKYIYTRYA